MKLDFPFYKQTTKFNCGPTTLKMALEFLGEKYPIKEMEEKTKLKREGLAYNESRNCRGKVGI